jgi:hypothetical protein
MPPRRIKDEIHVDLEYPRNEGSARYIVVDLMEVRAADGVRISYDFDRDGWVIEQAAVFRWECGDTVCDPKWREAAFLPAWQFEESAAGATPSPDEQPVTLRLSLQDFQRLYADGQITVTAEMLGQAPSPDGTPETLQ